jgi:hypothetical protein
VDDGFIWTAAIDNTRKECIDNVACSFSHFDGRTIQRVF